MAESSEGNAVGTFPRTMCGEQKKIRELRQRSDYKAITILHPPLKFEIRSLFFGFVS